MIMVIMMQLQQHNMRGPSSAFLAKTRQIDHLALRVLRLPGPPRGIWISEFWGSNCWCWPLVAICNGHRRVPGWSDFWNGLILPNLCQLHLILPKQLLSCFEWLFWSKLIQLWPHWSPTINGGYFMDIYWNICLTSSCLSSINGPSMP